MAGDYTLSAQLDSVLTTLEGELHPAAVFLFGSLATGRANDESDCDLGVLLGGAAPAVDAAFAIRLQLEEQLGRRVDLVLLDSASPILVMQVLRHGRLVACARPEELEAFTVRILTDYADLKIVRRPIEERLLQPTRR